jgi:hypothetical protein
MPETTKIYHDKPLLLKVDQPETKALFYLPLSDYKANPSRRTLMKELKARYQAGKAHKPEKPS